MLSEQNIDYISNNMIEKQEYNKYFIMIYKQIINKKEKKEIIKHFKYHYFPFDDKKDYKEDVIRIFGKRFVKEKEKKCKIIYNNKKYKLKEYLHEIDNNYNHSIKEIKLKIIGINNITDFTDMFHGCFLLLSVSESHISIDIFNDNNFYSPFFEEQKSDNINESNNIDINYELNDSFDLYHGYNTTSFENISSISKMGNIYNFGNSDNNMDCIQILSANNNKIKYMRRMFSGCFFNIIT